MSLPASAGVGDGLLVPGGDAEGGEFCGLFAGEAGRFGVVHQSMIRGRGVTELSRLLGLLLLVRDDCVFDKRCPHCGGELGQGYYVVREYTVRTLLEAAIEQAKELVAGEAVRELTRETEMMGLYEDAVGSEVGGS